MSKTNAEKASDLIWRHWQAGTVMDDLPAESLIEFLLEKGGGHRMAAGLTVTREKCEAAMARHDRHVRVAAHVVVAARTLVAGHAVARMPAQADLVADGDVAFAEIVPELFDGDNGLGLEARTDDDHIVVNRDNGTGNDGSRLYLLTGKTLFK